MSIALTYGLLSIPEARQLSKDIQRKLYLYRDTTYSFLKVRENIARRAIETQTVPSDALQKLDSLIPIFNKTRKNLDIWISFNHATLIEIDNLLNVYEDLQSKIQIIAAAQTPNNFQTTTEKLNTEMRLNKQAVSTIAKIRKIDTRIRILVGNIQRKLEETTTGLLVMPNNIVLDLSVFDQIIGIVYTPPEELLILRQRLATQLVAAGGPNINLGVPPSINSPLNTSLQTPSDAAFNGMQFLTKFMVYTDKTKVMVDSLISSFRQFVNEGDVAQFNNVVDTYHRTNTLEAILHSINNVWSASDVAYYEAALYYNAQHHDPEAAAQIKAAAMARLSNMPIPMKTDDQIENMNSDFQTIRTQFAGNRSVASSSYLPPPTELPNVPMKQQRQDLYPNVTLPNNFMEQQSQPNVFSKTYNVGGAIEDESRSEPSLYIRSPRELAQCMRCTETLSDLNKKLQESENRIHELEIIDRGRNFVNTQDGILKIKDFAENSLRSGMQQIASMENTKGFKDSDTLLKSASQAWTNAIDEAMRAIATGQPIDMVDVKKKYDAVKQARLVYFDMVDMLLTLYRNYASAHYSLAYSAAVSSNSKLLFDRNLLINAIKEHTPINKEWFEQLEIGPVNDIVHIIIDSVIADMKIDNVDFDADTLSATSTPKRTTNRLNANVATMYNNKTPPTPTPGTSRQLQMSNDMFHDAEDTYSPVSSVIALHTPTSPAAVATSPAAAAVATPPAATVAASPLLLSDDDDEYRPQSVNEASSSSSSSIGGRDSKLLTRADSTPSILRLNPMTVATTTKSTSSLYSNNNEPQLKVATAASTPLSLVSLSQGGGSAVPLRSVSEASMMTAPIKSATKRGLQIADNDIIEIKKKKSSDDSHHMSMLHTLPTDEIMLDPNNKVSEEPSATLMDSSGNEINANPATGRESNDNILMHSLRENDDGASSSNVIKVILNLDVMPREPIQNTVKPEISNLDYIHRVYESIIMAETQLDLPESNPNSKWMKNKFAELQQSFTDLVLKSPKRPKNNEQIANIENFKRLYATEIDRDSKRMLVLLTRFALLLLDIGISVENQPFDCQ